MNNAQILWLMQDLKSEHGENPEYDRALVDVYKTLMGIDHDQAARAIGVRL